MAELEGGGPEKLKGKKIAHLHIASAFGREPLPTMRRLAKEWGFTLLEVLLLLLLLRLLRYYYYYY